MERFITKNNIDRFCSTNIKYINGEIEKLVLEFPGFDGNSCLGGNFNYQENNSDFAKKLGEHGILSVYVYTGPWNWMRDISIKTVDYIVDAILEKYTLRQDIPIIATGGSMGGLGALMYTLKGKYSIFACAVSCPVCDLFELSNRDEYHFFCASVFFAFADCEGSFEHISKSYSPLYNTANMPKIPYFVIICDQDDVIPCTKHAYPFLECMKKENHNIQTVTAKNMGHCEHPSEILERFMDFVFKA